jgi:rod shape-determining protein MreC
MEKGLFRRTGQNTSLGFFVALSFLLVVLERVEYPVLDSFRSSLNDLFLPIISGVSDTVRAIGVGVDDVGEMADVYEENTRLREEIQRLKDWKFVAERLNMENKRLSELTNSRPIHPNLLVSPRVLSIIGGPYVRSALINAGNNDGVKTQLPVIDGFGIVGRTILVGQEASRILLLTDINSRIPVRLERSKQNGIAAGRNDDILDLLFLPVNADVDVGDVVLTSGDGGVFPPDMVLGRVSLVLNGRVRVAPAAHMKNLNFVQVLDWDPSMLEPGKDDAKTKRNNDINKGYN